MATTVIGYARVSTEEQAASGLSLQAQRERIEAYCVARGWHLADIVTDAGASARTLDRAGMRKVRRLMDEGLVDGVVALKLDRLTRSVADLHELLRTSERTGVALVSVTENMDTGTAAGKLMVTMLGAMAEWEREVISERTSAALKVKRSRGERVSRYAAIGAEDGARGHEERAALDELRTLMAGRGLTLRAMSAALAERGHRNRAGKPYHASAVKRMVERLMERHPELRMTAEEHEHDARRDRLAAVLKEAA
jgi:site-specific DNA recombinase